MPQSTFLSTWLNNGYYPASACASRGYVIGAGVHTYIYTIYRYTYVCGPNFFLNCTLVIDSPFQTFAVRTSRLIYRPGLPLLSPEMLSSSSKSRIFLYNATPCSICPDGRHNYPHKRIGKYRHFVNWNYNLGSKSADQTTSRIFANWERI